jgi:hypothetical protein
LLVIGRQSWSFGESSDVLLFAALRNQTSLFLHSCLCFRLTPLARSFGIKDLATERRQVFEFKGVAGKVF